MYSVFYSVPYGSRDYQLFDCFEIQKTMSRNELKVRIHQLETELMRDRTAEQKLMTVESKLRVKKEMEKAKNEEVEKLKMKKIEMEEAKDEEIMKLKKELEKMRMDKMEVRYYCRIEQRRTKHLSA
ncbi:unnamed protein product [Caenorhabditis brenneri]